MSEFGLPAPVDPTFMRALAEWLSAGVASGRLELHWDRLEHLIGDRGARGITYEAELNSVAIRLTAADTLSTQGSGKARWGMQLLDADGSVVDSLWSGNFKTDSRDTAIEGVLKGLCDVVEATFKTRRLTTREAVIGRLQEIV